jgi:hypothetical protein
MTTTLHTGERLASSWRDPLGRAGLVAQGVLYVLLGVLAIQFALGETSSDEVNQTGAFEQVGAQPFGRFLLVALTLGLAAMALWRLVQAAVGDPVEGDDASDRAEFSVKAVIYAALTATAAKVTVDNWSGGTEDQASGDRQQQEAASTLFDLPAGRWLVGILGVALVAVAAVQAYRHVVNTTFMQRLDPPPHAAGAIEAFGRAGDGARSVVLAISGAFFVVAAVQHDPNESKGISGALAELAGQGWGRVLLWGTALGLFAFGVFCLAEARYRRRT